MMSKMTCKCGHWYNTTVKCPECKTVATRDVSLQDLREKPREWPYQTLKGDEKTLTFEEQFPLLSKQITTGALMISTTLIKDSCLDKAQAKACDFIKWEDGSYHISERVLFKDYLHKAKVREAIGKLVIPKPKGQLDLSADALIEELGL